MAARTPAREYEDFEPTMNWEKEDKFDVLVVHLPGFRKDQLKVQITSAGNLRLLGERQVSGNKWRRFHKETPISSNYDVNKISAKFDNGNLQVKFLKIIVPAEPRGEAKPAVQPTKPPMPTTPTAEPQKIDQKQETKEPLKAEKAPAKPTEEEKKPTKSTEDQEKPKEVKEESKKAEGPKDGPETALRQKKSEDWVENKATERDQKHADTADTGKNMEKRGTKNADDIGKPRVENYKEEVGSFITKLRKLRHLMNTMVAALLIVALGLYVKHAFRSLGTTKSDPEL